MEIETAARRRLLQVEGVTGYVGQRVYKFVLRQKVEGTKGRAVVVRRSNGWAQPDTVQSSEFPLLVVDAWADPSRDDLGAKSADDAVDKALALYRVIDKALHGVRDETWGAGGSDPGLRVFSCVRWAEPILLTNPTMEIDGTLIGECAVVSTSYAVHTAH